VLCATDGEEALRLCDQTVPHIAVLDVVMPASAGRPLRNSYLEGFPDCESFSPAAIHGTAMSALRIFPELRICQKPYSPTNLGRLVREVLDGGDKPANS